MKLHKYWLLFQDCIFSSYIKIRDTTRLKFKYCDQKRKKEMKRGDGIDECWTGKKNQKITQKITQKTRKREKAMTL